VVFVIDSRWWVVQFLIGIINICDDVSSSLMILLCQIVYFEQCFVALAVADPSLRPLLFNFYYTYCAIAVLNRKLKEILHLWLKYETYFQLIGVVSSWT